MNIEAHDYSNRLIRQLYLRVLPVQILSMVISAINMLIDSLITSRVLGENAMVAIGLFGPVTTFLGLYAIFVTGMQLRCTDLLGKGDLKKVTGLFSVGFYVILLLGVGIGAALIGFREGVATMLGAEGEIKDLLSDYIMGVSIGLPGQMLASLLMAFLPMNNDMKLSSIGVGVMIVVNVSLDVLLTYVWDFGTFGMGLATSISCLCSAGVMFISFVKKGKNVHLKATDLQFRLFLASAVLGLPSMFFTISNTIKGYVVNSVLLSSGITAALAAMSVQNTICCLVGAVVCGAASTVTLLAGTYYGEEDRVGVEMVIRYSLKLNLALSAFMTIVVMAGAGPIASLFYESGSYTWAITRRMLIIFPCFMIFNTIFNVFMKLYQCQQRIKFVNFLTFAENMLVAGAAVVGMALLGVDGVWLAFPVAQILCVLLVGIGVWIDKKKITFSLIDWLRFSDDFGVGADDRMDLSLSTMDEVLNISHSIVTFCHQKGLDARRSMAAGLTIEEMAGNIIRYGFADGKKHQIDVRVVYKKNRLTIRIRDNCKNFDPIKYVSQSSPHDQMSNIGIRLIRGMTDEIIYLNHIGMNVLLARI